MVPNECRAGRVDQRRAIQVELAADVRTGQPHRAALVVSGGGEPFGEHQSACHVQPVGDQGGSGLVGQLGTVEIELTSDARAR